MIEIELRFSTPRGLSTFYVLVPEMRPSTFDAVMDKAGWEFDANRGAWVITRPGLRAEARLLHTEEHDTDFPVIITGRDSWRFVEKLVEVLGGGAG